MDEFRFNSINDLYNRLLPALKTKCNDLKNANILGICEKDIWDYLRYNYWNRKTRLTLGEMVDDILSTPDVELINYKKTLQRKDKENINV